MTISQWHVPIDDVKHYWYAIFTSFGAPVDKDEMRRQRLELYELPDYVPRKNKSNDYGFDRARAGARDLYRHGRRHQRARPVGLRIDGRDPGPHPGASRHVRQGDHRLSPAAAAGARCSPATAAADDGARSRRKRRRSPARPASTASVRPATGRAIGSARTRTGGRPKAGRMGSEHSRHSGAEPKVRPEVAGPMTGSARIRNP